MIILGSRDFVHIVHGADLKEQLEIAAGTKSGSLGSDVRYDDTHNFES